MRRLQANITVFFMLLAWLVGPGMGLALAAVTCPRVAFSPVLDGRLDDWPRLPQIVIADTGDWHPASAQFADYSGPEDVSADVWLAWDSEALYVALQVRDDEFVRVQSAAEIDRGDSIVLGMAGESSDVVNQFVIALLKSTSLVWRAEPSDEAGEVRTIGRAIAAKAEKEGGKLLVYELAFPWGKLDQLRSLAGTRFELSVSICDDDGDGLKGCLERTIAVGISAAGIEPLDIPEPPQAMMLKPIFPAPNVARFDEMSLSVNDRDIWLFGGGIDYTSLPVEAWPERLALLKSAGFNTVSISVPWAYHQPTSEPADLSRLDEFLRACSGAGLFVQIDIGPYVGMPWPAGGVPGWTLAGDAAARESAIDVWMKSLLSVVTEHQLSKGGPVAFVIVRALPDETGRIDSSDLWKLLASARSAEVVVPILTAEALVARDSSTQAMTNLLDTLSLYKPVELSELASQVDILSREEVGPAVLTAFPGEYHSAHSARRAMNCVRVAAAKGAAGVTLSQFAAGHDPVGLITGDERRSSSIIDASGAVTPGYGEAALLGRFFSMFGARLVRAVPIGGAISADDDEVECTLRVGEEGTFLFLWDAAGNSTHQVRLTYTDPQSGTKQRIPQAGSIYLPAGGAKILTLNLPLRRGAVRYCTSEIAMIEQVGERTLLVIYGDVDTPGEIALELPGPPLVNGSIARQNWDGEQNILTLDYYHSAEDSYLLVDEIEIAVLSRERATRLGTAKGESGTAVLSPGVHISRSTFEPDALEALLECPSGAVDITAALPKNPKAVMLDGEPVEFTFSAPERALRLDITTESFSNEQKPKSFWDRLGRAVVGGPTHSYARFDRSAFMPDADADNGDCMSSEKVAYSPESIGLVPGRFARLQSRFAAEDAAEIVVSGSRYPLLVSINGQIVPTLCGSAAHRRSDVSAFIRPGINQIEIIAHVLPRALGFDGLSDELARLPEVRLSTLSGEAPLEGWNICPGLAGEYAGYPSPFADTRRWHFIRFGPWREQGQDLADIWGVGWYRMTFDVPEAESWRMPYFATIDLRGSAMLYLNGHPLASISGDGKHRFWIPEWLLVCGEQNIIAAALYGMSPETGLYAVEVAADADTMVRKRTLEVRF